jgi:chorismate mutase
MADRGGPGNRRPPDAGRRDGGPGAGGSGDGGPGDAGPGVDETTVRAEAASELEGLRREIDALDVQIVALLNERARLGLAIGHAKTLAGWSGVRDPKREREVLLRVAMSNGGPLAQADLLAIYRRIIAATRALEDDDRQRGGSGGDANGRGVHGGRRRGRETLSDPS